MTELETHQEKFEKTKAIAERLEKIDMETCTDLESKSLAYCKSATRYQFIYELIKEGII